MIQKSPVRCPRLLAGTKSRGPGGGCFCAVGMNSTEECSTGFVSLGSICKKMLDEMLGERTLNEVRGLETEISDVLKQLQASEVRGADGVALIRRKQDLTRRRNALLRGEVADATGGGA